VITRGLATVFDGVLVSRMRVIASATVDVLCHVCPFHIDFSSHQFKKQAHGGGVDVVVRRGINLAATINDVHVFLLNENVTQNFV
jgi:hypothetical protein